MSAIPSEVARSYGDLPNSWRLGKLKFSARVRNSNVDKKTEDGEEPVRLCNYTDVYYNDRITPDMDFMEATATESEIERFTLKQGQVIITKDSEGWDDIGIPAYVTEDMPGVLCGYHLSVLEPDGESLDGAFLSWLCRADPLNDQFKLGSNGVTRYGLGQYPLKSSFIPLPDLDTQRRIAGYLDDKTARIDALIEKKRALMDCLAAKRQALITRAVTRGLNPDAPLKDSGIKWLGKVPAHWSVEALGYRYHVQLGRMLNAERAEGDNLRPYLRVNDVQWRRISTSDLPLMDFPPEAQERYRLEPGDLLINEGGSYVGRSAMWRGELAECYYQKALHRARPLNDERDTAEFMYFIMEMATQRSVFIAGGNQTTIDHLTAEQLRAYRFPFPPLAEQEAIVAFLEPRIQTFEALDEQINLSIEKLTEYRAALVTAGVTGKIKALLTDPAPVALMEEA